MRYSKLLVTAAPLLLLSACGGGDSNDESPAVTVSAELAEDTQWQSEDLFSGSAILLQSPSNGSIELSNSNITYTPAADFNGSDSAIVEAGTERFQFSFTVTPVNDAPTVSVSRISVVDENSFEGQLTVNDVDGDEVSLDISEQPETGTIALGSDGVFNYTLDELSLPASEFSVTADDGSEAVTVSLELVPAYNTNEEKAAYYYRSAKSHLKSAQQRLANINDDVITQPGYVALASGYVAANLDSQAEQLLQDQLVTQRGKAEAYRAMASTHDNFGQAEQAKADRDASFQQQVNYIADNGLSNISRDDTDFLRQLLSDYEQAGDLDGVEQVAEQFRTIAQSIGGINTEYTTAFGFMVTGFNQDAEARLERYYSDRNDTNLDRAIAAIDRARDMVRLTGYQIHTNGENEGKVKYQLAPLFSVSVIDYYFMAGQTEKAKDQLAWTLSYFTEADYDPEHSYAAKTNTDISLAEYPFPLVDTARLFALLYPGETNVALDLLVSDDSYYSRAEGVIGESEALREVIFNNDVQAAIDIIENTYADDVRDLQEAYSGRSYGNPYTGGLLAQLGYHEAAATLLKRGIQFLASDTHLAEEDNTLYTTSTRGCLKYIQYADDLSLGDAAKDELMELITNQCETIVDKQFANADGTRITEFDRVEAWTDLAELHHFVGNNSDSQVALQQAESLLPNITDLDDQESLRLRIINSYGRINAFTEGLAAWQPLVERWTNTDGSIVPEQTEDNVSELASHIRRLINFMGNTDSITASPVFLEQLRISLPTDNYEALMTSFNESLTMLTDELVKRFEQQPAPAQLDLAEGVVNALAYARKYQQADQLLADSLLAVADQLDLQASLSAIQAQQDDFPATQAASVDSDLDGLVNFFAVNASEQMREDSNLEADDDSDNDGITDAEDPTPLG